MRRQGHKRSRTGTKVVVLTTALALGAGGVAVITANASAGGGGRHDSSRGGNAWWASHTIRCPDVGSELQRIPRPSARRVSTNLGRLDGQVADAYRQLASGRVEPETILEELRRKRARTLRNIHRVTNRRGFRGRGFGWMSRCEMQDGGNGEGQEPEEDEEGQDGQDGGGEGGVIDDNGPSPEDFVDITTVQPNVEEPQLQEGATTGSFTTECGRNEEGHFNSDNIIVAPGVDNGARHTHDYVGNLSTDGFSTDESLAAADTTCDNGDKSTHYWPVLRLRDGTEEFDHNDPGGGLDGNIGKILKPATVSLTFNGSPAGEVTEMPRFLRIITGDAKAFTNDPVNANSSWSCTGFEDRVQLTERYPICPEGSQVVRTFDFQSCWDGENTDSANHRDHVDFRQEDGTCKDGFVAIPQLVQRITYDVPAGEVYAVDGFPEQLHKPITDHGDFINVMPEDLMAEAVECINSGRDCE